MHNSLERVWDFITGRGLLTGKEKNILVGLSGGADSVCLLFMLKAFKDEGRLGDTNILAAHLNHGIRGYEALRDEDFVKALCKKMSVKLFSKKLDIPGLARESGDGEEETGRKYRYAFFREVLDGEGGGVIATAHHKNDLAETVMINLARGTGISGLAGIKVCQGDIRRPLICLTRKEIEEFNKAHDLGYVTDSTNEKDIYTRNFLRNRVIPLIEENVNPGFTEHIYRLSDIALSADEYLEKQAEKLFKKCLNENDDVVIPAKEISAEERIVREYLYRLCYKKVKGSGRDLSAERIDEVDRLLSDVAGGRRIGKIIELTGGINVFSEHGKICFSTTDRMREKQTSRSPMMIPLFIEKTKKRLEAGEEVHISSERVNVILKLTEFFVKNSDTDYTKYFDYGKISDTACLRYAEKDDYILVTASGHRHSLKKELKDRKIPAAKRRYVLIVAQGNECLWAVGVRRGMSLPAREGGRVLEVTVVLSK